MPDAYRLSPEQIANLREAQPHINAARANIERLKRIGLDVSQQEAELESAVNLRDGLLREFSPTGRPPTK